MQDVVAFDGSLVVEVEVLDHLAGGEPGGPDPVGRAVGGAGGGLGLQAGGEVFLVGPAVRPGALGEPLSGVPQCGGFQDAGEVGDLAGGVAGHGFSVVAAVRVLVLACCGRDGRRGEFPGEGAAFGALGVQGFLGALGPRDGGAGELAGGFFVRLAGGLQRRDLACGLLTGGGESVLAGLAGLGQRGGGAFCVVAGGLDRGVALADGRL